MFVMTAEKISIAIIIPLIITGGGWVFTYATLYSDVALIKSKLKDVESAQLELARRGQWMNSIESDIDELKDRLDDIDATDRYTRTDAESDKKKAEDEANRRLQIILKTINDRSDRLER